VEVKQNNRKEAHNQLSCFNISKKNRIAALSFSIASYLLFYLQRLQNYFERSNYIINSSGV